MRIIELENRCTGNRTVGSNPTLSVPCRCCIRDCCGFEKLHYPCPAARESTPRPHASKAQRIKDAGADCEQLKVLAGASQNQSAPVCRDGFPQPACGSGSSVRHCPCSALPPARRKGYASSKARGAP